MKTVKIEVTQGDIQRNGHSIDGCPVYYAIKRHAPRLNIRVGAVNIYFSAPNNTRLFFDTDNKEVRDWVNRYDRTETGEPFSFLLPIPKQLEEYFNG